MEEMTCCAGTVHSVIFQNAENGYTVLRLLTEEGEVITVVGCIPCVAPGEHLTVGQKIKVFLTEINHEAKGPVISLSRVHPKLVWRLFELEVPEIQEGIVIIRGVSREAGSRSKIAVYSRDADVDAVGACIGTRNMRIDTIVNELKGEKIDIVKYSEIPEEYIAAALAPATVNSVVMTGERACRVTVDPDQLSLAIGREGQNVRLAARLTGYKIDIKAE